MFKKFALGVIFLLASSAPAFAAAPVIFFSDLVSGPNSGGQNDKGVFVTIVGKNFGASRSTSKVTIGGGAADNYPVWSDTKITFQLGPSASTGNITVTTPEGTSNGIPFTVRPGRIFFVDDTSPNSPGSGTYSDPWRSPASFYSARKAGDTCYFRAGTYSGKYGYTAYHCNFTIRGVSGSANNEIAFVGYPGEVARIVAGSEPTGNFEWPDRDSYYVVAGLTLQGSGRGCATISGTGHRIVNNDCIGNTAFAYGLIFPTGSDGAKIYGNKMHGMYSGNKLSHLLYLAYGASNTDFGWNHIYDNNIDVGPVISTNTDGGAYRFSNNIIHDNIIDGSGRARGIGFIAQARGSSCKIYNNRFINCGGGSYAAYIWSGSVDLYNNTFYGSTGTAVYVGGQYGYQPETVRIRNNAFYNNSGVGYISVSGESSMTSLSIDHNAYYGNGNGPSRDTYAVNGNPLFVNASGKDFHLQDNSPLINKGADLSALISRDPDGVVRPQSAFDIGAFEYPGVSVPNSPPVFLSLGNKSVAENSPLSFKLSATDPNGDALTYSASGLPSGAALSGDTFSWTPSYSQAGSYTVTFTVSDGKGGTDDEACVITVSDVNRAPVLSVPGDRSVSELAPLTFTVSATDPDGDPITLSGSNLPSGASFNASSGTFDWTPSGSQAGTYTVTFTAGDGSLTDSRTVKITVAESNRAPVLSYIEDKSVGENSTLNFKLSAADADNDTLIFAATGMPQGASLDSSSGQFTWLPAYGQAGTYEVVFTVSDGALSDTESMVITVTHTNRPPVIEPVLDKSVDENSQLSFTVTATDPDNDPVTVGAEGLPQGAVFNAATRTCDWTPDFGQSGSYNVTFTASDGKGGTASETVKITVNDVNRTPELVSPGNRTVPENGLLSFSVEAFDPDGDVLAYAAAGLPEGAVFQDGIFSWTPGHDQSGEYNITFTVSDPKGGVDSETIVINVTDVNRSPVISPLGDKNVAVNSPLSFSVSASDPDGDTVTLAAQGVPQGASFNASTGSFTWTPLLPGTHIVTFVATDGKLSASLSVEITVADTPHIPVMTAIGPKSVSEGETVTFTVNASDEDDDPLTYSAANLPQGAVFNDRTFTWSPEYDQAGVYQVEFKADDGHNGIAAETVAITVSNVNRPPTLAPIGPRSVTENQELSFTVEAADPDGETLDLSALNLPQGAEFDVSGRVFSWLPSFDQAGTYQVTFTVTDTSGGTANETVTITVDDVDIQPPLLEPLNPGRDEMQVPAATPVILRVRDEGKGVDKDSIHVEVKREGDTSPLTVIDGGTGLIEQKNSVSVSGTPQDYLVTYTPPRNRLHRFTHDQEVTVTVKAADLAGNAMDDSYSFTTAMLLRGANNRISDASDSTGTGAGGMDNAGVAADATGMNIYAVWQDTRGRIWFNQSNNGGAFFGSQVRLSGDGDICANPVIAVDSQSNLYVAWERENEANGADLYLARRLNGEDEFETAVVPADTAFGGVSDQREPALTVSPDGTVIIGWVNSGAREGVYYAVSGDRGAGLWNVSAPVRVDDGSGTGIQGLSLAADSQGNKYAAWSSVKSGKRAVYFNKFDKAGKKGYASERRVNQGIGEEAANPWIAVRPVFSEVPNSANICVVWENTFKEETDIRFNHSFSGLSWGAGTTVNDDGLSGRPQREPKVAVNSDGLISVIWSDERSGDPDIYLAFSLDSGDSFKTNMLVNDDAGNSSQGNPSVSFGESGEDVLMVWTDSRGTGSEIFFNRNCRFDESNAVTARVEANTAAVIRGEKSNPALADAEVAIPQAALGSAVNVSLTRVELPPPFSGGRQPRRAIDFGPSGTAFSRPVTIKIPYGQEDIEASGVAGASGLKIYYYNLKTLLWERIDGSFVDSANSRICAEVPHFSIYAIGPAAAVDGAGESAAPGGSGGGGGGGGCFIATAAYGSADEPDVVALRRFRDRRLLTTGWGREFVKFYYRHSPAIAKRIERNDTAKAAVRLCLKPLVILAKLLAGQPS